MITQSSPSGPLAPSTIETEAEAALTRMQERRSLKRAKRSKKPTVTILSRETSAITKRRHHASYQGRKDGSVSFTRQFITPTQHALVTLATEQVVQDVSPLMSQINEDPLIPDIDVNTFNPHRSRKRTAGVSIHSILFLTTQALIVLQDRPLLMWLKDREIYLEELLRFEGREHFASACALCGAADPCYTCKDCVGRALLCEACVLSCHYRNPLHMLKVRFNTLKVHGAQDNLLTEVEWNILQTNYSQGPRATRSAWPPTKREVS